MTGAVSTVRIEVAKLSEKGDKDEAGQRVLTRMVKYHEDGNKIEEVTYKPDGSISKRAVFFLDDNGEKTGEAEYTSDGSLLRKLTYLDDSKGQRVEDSSYGSEGTPQPLKGIYDYDDKGNRTGLAIHKPDGSAVSNLDSTYDDNGRLIESLFRTGEGALIAKSVITYSPRGDQVEAATYNAAGVLIGKIVFSFDDKGNQIGVAQYEADGTLQSKTSYDRDFDSQGNWIKETVSSWSVESAKFEPTSVTYRTITYY